jgi:hypothetical protein
MPRKQAPRIEFSQAKFDEICALIAAGGKKSSLRAVCELPGMPTRQTFNEWRKRSKELQEQYDNACLDRADVMFDEIVEIADECRTGTKTVTKETASGKFTETTEIDMVERAKVQIDARKWVLARMNRKKYGDRVTNELVGEGGGAVIHKVEFEIVDAAYPGPEKA